MSHAAPKGRRGISGGEQDLKSRTGVSLIGDLEYAAHGIDGMEGIVTMLKMRLLRELRFSLILSTIAAGISYLCQAPLCAQEMQGLSFDHSGWVSVGADRLFYEEAGEGPATVLIHDGLVHREIWDAQMPVLSGEFRVIRYDRRGYGSSPAPTEPFSNLDDLNSLFDQLNVEQANLIAMSSGGRLAIDFTLEHPEKVRSLVLVGAVVGGFSYTQHFFNRGGHLPAGLSASARRDYYASADPYEIFPENTAARQRVIELVENSPIHDHGRFPSSRPDRPALARLHEIEVPTLILVGEFDMPDVHAHAGAINAGIRGSDRKIINKAGHLVPIEQPATFNEAVLDFLRIVNP